VVSVRSIWSGALAATMVFSAAGCGGGDSEPLSADAFRQRANGICKNLNAETEKAFAKIDTKDQDAMVRATQDLGLRTDKALEQLGELEGPEASEAAIDTLLSRAKALGEVNAKRASALSSGDADAAEKAEADAKRLTAEAQTAAQDAGLDDCS